MSDDVKAQGAHDQARSAYEHRNNYGIVRAENGGIRMEEAHHSRGWEEGFWDGWRAAQSAPLVVGSREALAGAIEEAFGAYDDLDGIGKPPGSVMPEIEAFTAGHLLASGIVRLAADVVREAKAEAWEEGAEAERDYQWRCEDADSAGQGVMILRKKNPYRTGGGNQ